MAGLLAPIDLRDSLEPQGAQGSTENLVQMLKGGVVNFLNQLLRGIAFIPGLVTAIESLFASKTGLEKKDAAMTFLENALATVDAVAAREIVDPAKFKEGISKIIDGTVQCLNASTWAKGSIQAPAVSTQP